MKKVTLLLLAFLFLSPVVFAQDSDIDDDMEIEEPTESSKKKPMQLNESGDQFIRLAIMMTCPLNFGGSFPLYRTGQMNTGGSGAIGYHRFLTSWFALGLDISFGYNPTLGNNVFTYVPIILNMTFEPTLGKFEFTMTVGVGGSLETYLSRSYFPGFTVKADAGVFYRVAPGWSFGIEGDFMYMPQWYSSGNSEYKNHGNDYGNFLSFGLAARYHF